MMEAAYPYMLCCGPADVWACFLATQLTHTAPAARPVGRSALCLSHGLMLQLPLPACLWGLQVHFIAAQLPFIAFGRDAVRLCTGAIAGHGIEPAACWTGQLLALCLGPEQRETEGVEVGINAVISSIACTLLQV